MIMTPNFARLIPYCVTSNRKYKHMHDHGMCKAYHNGICLALLNLHHDLAHPEGLMIV